MIKIKNGPYTRSLIFEIFKGFKFAIGIKTIKWLRAFFKKGYNFFDYNKSFKKRKFRTKGTVVQEVKKIYRIFFLNIETWKIEEYSKRHVYTWMHKKKYLKQQPGVIERVKKEVKYYIGKKRVRKYG